MFAIWEKLVEQNQPQSSQSQQASSSGTPKEDVSRAIAEVLSESLFDEEEPEQNKKDPAQIISTYKEWVASKSKFFRTTGIAYGRGEKTFADYAAALSEDLKNEILESFDCEADYILQQEIAALYKNKNSMSLDQFVKSLRAMGLKVEPGSRHTSYIIDDKKDRAHHGGELSEGNIRIYTISDPETGAEIKIVDSNGNAEIELEEIFLNELLEGVARDIDTSNFQKASNIHVSTSSGGELSGSGGEASRLTSQTTENSSSSNGRTEITKKQYDELKKCLQEKYIENGLSKETAFEKARSHMEKYYTIADNAKYININKTVEKVA